MKSTEALMEVAVKVVGLIEGLDDEEAARVLIASGALCGRRVSVGPLMDDEWYEHEEE